MLFGVAFRTGRSLIYRDSLIYKHPKSHEIRIPQWCSGNIIPSQGIALGSIPSCGKLFLRQGGPILFAGAGFCLVRHLTSVYERRGV